jgi:hypothetical protein
VNDYRERRFQLVRRTAVLGPHAAERNSIGPCVEEGRPIAPGLIESVDGYLMLRRVAPLANGCLS